MSRFAQAFDSLPASVFASASLKIGALVAMLALAGCGMGGFSLEKADVDRSIVTSNVPVASPEDANLMTDQTTIRNAVSSADPQSLAGKSISWANPATGSRGSITLVAEDKSSGRLCRRFDAMRESFDGVSLFKGETCMVADGVWQMQAFTAQ